MKKLKITIKQAKDSIDDDNHLWRVSRDLWRKGEVTFFLKDQVAGLKDANGAPLPDHAKKFFLDILFQKIKLPKKGRKIVFSETAVKQVFKSKLEFHEINKWMRADNGIIDVTPNEAALIDTAKIFGISEGGVSDIIYPRASRKKKSPT